MLQKIAVDFVGGIGNRDRLDLLAQVLDESILVLEVKPMVKRHLAIEALHHHGLLGADHQYIRLIASHFLFSLLKPAP